MTLANYTFIFNGLTIGSGTSFLISNIDGLGGTPPLRIQDDNRGYLDGSFSGRDFYDERTVYFDVTVIADAVNSAQANYFLLQKAFAPQPLGYYPNPTTSSVPANELKKMTFRLNADTGDMIMYGRSRGLSTPINPEFTYGYIQTRIQMTFPDPRYYSNTQSEWTTTTGTISNMHNNGWAIDCPLLLLPSATTNGSTYDITISDGTTVMAFNDIPYAANSIAGVANSAVAVDLLTRTIYLAGVPANYLLSQYYTNGWLQLNPNSTSTWTVSSSNPSTYQTFAVYFRNAYI